MRLSVETGTLRRKFDDETAIRMISEAGFDAFDYSFFWTWGTSDDMLGDDYLEKAHKLRKLADELGIECNQAHAPMEYAKRWTKVQKPIFVLHVRLNLQVFWALKILLFTQLQNTNVYPMT